MYVQLPFVLRAAAGRGCLCEGYTAPPCSIVLLCKLVHVVYTCVVTCISVVLAQAHTGQGRSGEGGTAPPATVVPPADTCSCTSTSVLVSCSG